MTLTVFYSWQSDTPSNVNRNFIEDALQRALEQINADAEVVNSPREVVLDKDTRGVPGTPPIVETIFNKIDQCSVFVPDLTFVAKTKEGRPTPNANVLIEYGWALKSKGHQWIVPVMNEAFGAPTETSLPFNMRHLRWPIRYKVPDGNQPRAEIRNRLVEKLADAIGQILRNTPIPSEPEFEATPSTYDKAAFSKPQELIATGPGRFSEHDKEFFVPEQGPKMFLRLLPTAPTEQLSGPQAYDLARKGRLQPFALRRITGGEWYSRNKYGAIVYREGREEFLVEDLTQLFKNRELWGATYGLLSYQSAKVMPNYYVNDFEHGFVQAFENYIAFARETS